ncbi:polysaccharide deacetylase [Hydrogenophaga sp. 5NK40-0174]|uniref:polysaccharide deacetylase n=1 Tax=Hydrogenophaga sp. 5NK40-0174 TaxID=3127649 RepID=UPI003106FF98
MIRVIAPGSSQTAQQVVVSALTRSCGFGGVTTASFTDLMRGDANQIWVIINPLPQWSHYIGLLLSRRSKLLLLGRLPPALAACVGAEIRPASLALKEAAACAPAPIHGFSHSPAYITYRPETTSEICGGAPIMASRPLRRYDFAAEWNNLGWGAINADGDMWSIAQELRTTPERVLASIRNAAEDQDFGAYAALWMNDKASALWFNRPVGPVDSNEWRHVEDFMSCHRPDVLPCIPVLAEVPHGHTAAATMRLDCDEDVESARSLWMRYQRLEVPLSLALHSSILTNERQHALPGQVQASGGAILSHTATHAPNWGGSWEGAHTEGAVSIHDIRHHTGLDVRYAVSPFHHTPSYARLGLADAGFLGCIGGIICNDPDFLMARSGVPVGSPAGFIGHSQQCMLHGDCLLHDEADPLRIYKQAADEARAAGTFFGYLDHPFSDRYQYGWASEEQRGQAHEDLVRHLQQTPDLLFANEDQAMDFLHDRAHVRIARGNRQGWRLRRHGRLSPWPVAVRYQGEVTPLETEVTLS